MKISPRFSITPVEIVRSRKSVVGALRGGWGRQFGRARLTSSDYRPPIRAIQRSPIINGLLSHVKNWEWTQLKEHGPTAHCQNGLKDLLTILLTGLIGFFFQSRFLAETLATFRGSRQSKELCSSVQWIYINVFCRSNVLCMSTVHVICCNDSYYWTSTYNP
jgi:hypothetical protein